MTPHDYLRNRDELLTHLKDYSRARDIYKTALKVIPNKQFTFSKVWVQFAYFELRRLDLVGARKILGTAIGMCPKESIFKKYIQMEIDVSYPFLLFPFSLMCPYPLYVASTPHPTPPLIPLE